MRKAYTELGRGYALCELRGSSECHVQLANHLIHALVLSGPKTNVVSVDCLQWI